MKERFRQTFGFLGLMGLLEGLLFFSKPGHFFQGDTLEWFGLRYRSLTAFAAGFTTLDPGGWYRPLTQRTIQSLLFPVVGLNPLPYRAITFVLFMLCVALVFLLVGRFTGSRRAGMFGTLFFGMNVTHTFTTYDVAFTPELVFTAFGLGSVLAYQAFCRTLRSRDKWLSAAFCCGALLSKEAAVTVPLILAAVWWMREKRERPPASSLIPQFAALAAYLALVSVSWHVGGFDPVAFLKNPNRQGTKNYEMTTTRMPRNLDVATSWAFNLPRGTEIEWGFDEQWMPKALRLFRAFVLLAATGAALFSSQRRLLVLGLCWFCIGLAPVLLLGSHFLPTYLCWPLAGFALFGGTALNFAYEQVQQRWGFLAPTGFAAVFSLAVAANASAGWSTAETAWLAGGSARTNAEAIANLRASYPSLRSGTTVGVMDGRSGFMAWSFGKDALVRLAYADETLRTRFPEDGPLAKQVDLDAGRALVFQFGSPGFRDYTHTVKAHREMLVTFAPDRRYSLEVFPPEVRAGSSSYAFRVPQLPDSVVRILYRDPSGEMDAFAAKLNRNGEVRFPVGPKTARGAYLFLAVHPEGEDVWTRVEGQVVVR